MLAFEYTAHLGYTCMHSEGIDVCWCSLPTRDYTREEVGLHTYTLKKFFLAPISISVHMYLKGEQEKHHNSNSFAKTCRQLLHV